LITTSLPDPRAKDDTFTDARLAETFADEALLDHFIWVDGLSWLGWDGRTWEGASEVTVVEIVRQHVLDRFREEVNNEPMNDDAVAGWKTLLSSSRINTILKLSRGLVKREVPGRGGQPANARRVRAPP